MEGPQAELTLTANAQPALVAHSYASLLALGETRTERLTPKWSVGAGYSLGEWSAYLAAGVFTLEDVLALVWHVSAVFVIIRPLA